MFGDATAIYRRDIFARVVPVHERHGVGLEDWHFYLRASLAGASILSLPCALFQYWVSGNSMLATTDPYGNWRVIADLLVDVLPPAFAPLGGFIRGLLIPL